MGALLKYITGRVYRPILAGYLSSERGYQFRGIRLQVPAGVFHPGFFFSTKILLNYLGGLPLQGRSLLELGAGSGLIAFFAAGRGAVVTATDINPVAVDALKRNSARNRLPVRVMESDLFAALPSQRFDLIAVNPPYYRRNPVTAEGYAWYCGEHGEYFAGLFRGLGDHVHAGSEVYMILSDGCDLPMIRELAGRYGWVLVCVLVKKNWLETNFIYRILRGPGEPADNSG